MNFLTKAETEVYEIVKEGVERLRDEIALLTDENKNYASFLRRYCNLDQEQIESVAGIADCCDK